MQPYQVSAEDAAVNGNRESQHGEKTQQSSEEKNAPRDGQIGELTAPIVDAHGDAAHQPTIKGGILQRKSKREG